MHIRDIVFALLLAVLSILTYLIVQPFATYVLGAGLLAFMLRPLQRRYAPRFGPRLTAFGLTALALGLLVVPTAVVVLAALDIAASEGGAGRPILAQIERLSRRFGIPVEIPSDAVGVGTQFIKLFAGEFTQVIEATVSAVVGLSLFVFLLYYLLFEGPQFVAWVRRLTPLPEHVQDELYGEAIQITWAVIKGHLLVGLAQGLLGGVGLFATGVPNAALLTLAMVLFAFVPVVGVAAVWVPAGVYLLLVGQVLAGGLLLLYGATVISWIDNYLRAFLVDRGGDLHPAVVLVGVVGGIFAMGPLGLFFGPIVLALFKATLIVVHDYYSF